jgi:hypothetical protein
VPPVADQLITGFVTPGRVKVNCCCCNPLSVAVVGAIVSDVTMTDVLAVIVALAEDVAVIVWVVFESGAV